MGLCFEASSRPVEDRMKLCTVAAGVSVQILTVMSGMAVNQFNVSRLILWIFILLSMNGFKVLQN